jgi:hypothetical protein
MQVKPAAFGIFAASMPRGIRAGPVLCSVLRGIRLWAEEGGQPVYAGRSRIESCGGTPGTVPTGTIIHV